MNYNEKLPQVLQHILNVCLLLVGLLLCISLFKATWDIFAYVVLPTDNDKSYYEFTDDLLVFFLYFEFIALIIKYFSTGFHFPLRYFIYIGITAVIRLILIEHDRAIDTFWWAAAILVMVGALLIVNHRLLKRES
ncbi:MULTISPECIES: phosphate-starvation-inducible protein PsiE [unclassified Paenibacillus]|uniref:phosphate-starvation-inducible protein PsiE n=1 Tax=unclassified Paenibacillus TaxID=185978 RepID=UPI000897788E|nr:MULTISPECIES: phosphate-starvation-inducible protein PsiE [unclassified Paenibacillus]OMC64356.1 phosphate-starvation-inducible protein PsiE [Paenibacillus sp. FSL H7-0326]SDX57472.1 protein PsiE [Paenibacillus sp. PDC88]